MIGCCVVLLVSLVALSAAFVTSLDSASRHLARAAAAQAQAAAVSRIETLASDGDRTALNVELDAYARSIAAETALLPRASIDRAAQIRESVDADRLRMLAADLRRTDALTTLVAAIRVRERDEALQVAADMTRLKDRTTMLAILLAVAAGGAAILGALGLIAANRRLADEVAARTAELTMIDASRRLFFAKASHEMRTPVTVMRGEAEVALAVASQDSGALRDALTQVVANAEFLEHRIAELLGLASAENGQLQLDAAVIDLIALVRDARSAAHGYARSVEVAIHLAAPDMPVAISGDARWLQQAVLAILDNAVKFSPPAGAVTLRLARDATHATILIGDHGIGVAAVALPRIFDAYYQTENGRARGGTGLGLALARWVIEQHQGTVEAANRAEGGCVVTIRLPLTPSIAARSRRVRA